MIHFSRGSTHIVFLNQHYPPDLGPTRVILCGVIEKIVAEGIRVTMLCSEGGYFGNFDLDWKSQLRRFPAIKALLVLDAHGCANSNETSLGRGAHDAPNISLTLLRRTPVFSSQRRSPLLQALLQNTIFEYFVSDHLLEFAIFIQKTLKAFCISHLYQPYFLLHQ